MDIFHIWASAELTCNQIHMVSKDSNQAVCQTRIATVLVHPSLESPRVVEGTRDQQILWSDCADAQADLSLRWSHKSYCRFCRALVHIRMC